MIESIYIDLAGDDANRVSRYTVLIEQLRAAEQAKINHDQMSARVARLHAERVARVRRELEAEGERLRNIIRASRA